MISVLIAVALAGQAAPVESPPTELPVATYSQKNANAGAKPFKDDRLWRAFHGRAGVDRIVDDFVDRLIADKRIMDIFQGQDIVRLRRTLKEQFCYLLGGGCNYTGRTMAEAHKNMGLQTADFNALVEDLQAAMRKEHVRFFAQNRLLAKLAPMRRNVVER